MGGSVSLQSKLGEGSTFTVYLELPLTTQESALDIAASESRQQGPQVRLKVLVAEDDGVNRLVIRMLLHAQDHDGAGRVEPDGTGCRGNGLAKCQSAREARGFHFIALICGR